MGNPGHWDRVYNTKSADAVSWYRPHLERSLRFVLDSGIARDAAILDVGGGASTFVDDLLGHGFTNVSVLDVADAGLARARERLGARAAEVRWIVGDVTALELPAASIDFWHDRAVFHFLTDPAARAHYVEGARRVVRPGGFVLVATFGPGGPGTCSGLPVATYDASGIHETFGPGFRKSDEDHEVHVTPWGSAQEFVYCLCRTEG